MTNKPKTAEDIINETIRTIRIVYKNTGVKITQKMITKEIVSQLRELVPVKKRIWKEEMEGVNLVDAYNQAIDDMNEKMFGKGE